MVLVSFLYSVSVLYWALSFVKVRESGELCSAALCSVPIAGVSSLVEPVSCRLPTDGEI